MNAATDVFAAPPPIPPAPPAPVRAPGVGEAIGLLALYFALQLAVGFTAGSLVGLVVGMRIGFAHGGAKTGGDHTLHALQVAMSNPDLRTGVTAATLLIAASVTLWIVHRRWPRQWRLAQAWQGFGFAPSSSVAFYAAALALGVAVPVIGGMLTHLLAGSHPVTQSIAQMGQSASLGGRVVLALSAVTLGPLVEEALFRGVLFSSLLGFRQRQAMLPAVGNARIVLAIGLSALLFGMVHLPDLGWRWYAVPNLALLGIGCAWLRLKSGSLWPAVMAHGINNLLAVAGWFVMTHPPG
ncbi:CPBP family intramembrane metalloprotease [Dyella ginsengisoli]|uniref:CPBP family intramembrane metalloprotease n=1 Tax=Dyella ginsengisoli TaxID=363848 RepID=A0ABW8JR33_9GAMM